MREVHTDGSPIATSNESKHEPEQEWERLARTAATSKSEEDKPDLLRELLSFELADAPDVGP